MRALFVQSYHNLAEQMQAWGLSLVLGGLLLIGWWWYYYQQQQQQQQSSKELEEMNEEHRRARLARLDKKQPSVVQEDKDNNNNKKDETPSPPKTTSGPKRKLSPRQNNNDATAAVSVSSSSLKKPPPPAAATASTTSATTKKTTAAPAKQQQQQQQDGAAATTGSQDVVRPKPKKRRNVPPPSQVLSQALSHVLARDILVVSQQEDNAEAEKKTTATTTKSKQQPSHRLVLPVPFQASTEDDWDRLEEYFCNTLLPTNCQQLMNDQKNHHRSGCSIRESVNCHSRLQVLLRDGWRHQKYAGLDRCLAALSSQCILPPVTAALLEDMSSSSSSSHDDRMDVEDDDGGLFAESYASSYTTATNTTTSTATETAAGAVEQLLQLLEEPAPIVSASFLQDLFLGPKTKASGVVAKQQQEQDQEEPAKDLASFLVQQVLRRLKLSSLQSCAVLQRRLNALTNLLSLAPAVVGRVLAARIPQELAAAAQNSCTGLELQQFLWLAPLFEVAAYSIPAAGSEQVSVSAMSALAARGPNNNRTTSASSSLFGKQLAELPRYPVSIFERTKTANSAHDRIREECRRIMISGRRVTESALRVLFRGAGDNKRMVFAWLRQMAESNEAMATLAKPDLLAVDGCTATCSSRAFLLGVSNAVVNFCRQNLISKFQKQGAAAFDVQYMMQAEKKEDGFFQSHTAALYPAAAEGGAAKMPMTTTTSIKFSGATEFFFLSCALLRVALYPVLRMQDEFLYRYNKALDTVEVAAIKSQTLPPHAAQQLSPVVTAWLGFRTFLEDPEYVANITDFVLLQLEWLQTVIVTATTRKNNGTGDLGAIPDWMCKEPSRWLSHAARHSWHLLKPHQAEKAVEVATCLLQLGTKNATTTAGGGAASFSPVVVTALVRIAASYVQAGVARAKQKQRHQQQRRQRRFGNNSNGDAGYDDEPDDDEVDIYLSFDQNDLGVAVFTNARVQTDLCPTLMQAFQSLDIVEGLDVDREHAFDKFQVKLEITELFLRLWSHPNGKSRQSVLQLAPANIAHFASSISAAIGYLLDDACLRMADVCKFSNQPRRSPAAQRQYNYQSSLRDKQFQEAQTRATVGNFANARSLLLLLVRLSREPSIAAILGGQTTMLGGGGVGKAAAAAASKKDNDKKVTTAADLAIMVIHFLDLMTSAEGGTHPDLEYERNASVSTLALVGSVQTMSMDEKQRLATSVARSRYLARSRIGFDASTMSHQFLALVAKWHLAAINGNGDSTTTTNNNSRETPILLAMAAHDDCDVARYKKILERLVDVPAELAGSEVDNAAAIFKHDGYVPCTNWAANYDQKAQVPNDNSEKRNRSRARRNQMSRLEISTLSSHQDISAFLADLEECVGRKRSALSSKLVAADKVPEVERQILESSGSSEDLREEQYGETLSEWTMSSSPFANSSSPSSEGGGGGEPISFAHFYDSTARSHGSAGSGKVLIKEAKRCHKTLPKPHPNSATFICYAEERMDLCRAIVTGPVDTPYSLGIFVFDAYYPILYPRIPPLVAFMTTGGGQTRFNPNLYSDSKICLSLLGTFHALDDSERWNEQLSSLAQVLLSIQTQLLVKEPYFNEPGAERMKGTASGDASSTRYNAGLRLATLRHAVLNPLRNPPIGFEEVTLRHFSMCRKRLVTQAKRWMLEAKGSSLYPRFVRVYAELLFLLSSKDGINKYASLPPLADDLAALSRLDPGFSYKGDDGDRKPSAAAVAAASSTANNGLGAVPGGENWNPWASPATNTGVGGSTYNHQGKRGDDPDEELYI